MCGGEAVHPPLFPCLRARFARNLLYSVLANPTSRIALSTIWSTHFCETQSSVMNRSNSRDLFEHGRPHPFGLLAVELCFALVHICG